MDDGAKLVTAVGGLGNAARQIQLVRSRELRNSREFVDRTQRLYPDISEEIMSLYTNGAAPRYARS